MPTTGAETSEVIEFFTTQRDVVGVAAALTPLAWVLATVFGAGAVAALWRAERERGAAWSLVGFAGILLQNLTFTGVMAARLALAAMPEPDAGTVARLWAFHKSLFAFSGTFLATAMRGLSIDGKSTGLVRCWHAATGLVATVLQFGSAAVLSPLVIDSPERVGLLGLAGWLIWVTWVVGYGIRLIRAPQKGPKSPLELP